MQLTTLIALSLTLIACTDDTGPDTTSLEPVLCANHAPATRERTRLVPVETHEPTGAPRYVLVGPVADSDPECGEIRVEFWTDLDDDPHVDATTVTGNFYPGTVIRLDTPTGDGQGRIDLVVGMYCSGETSGGPWQYLELID